MWRSFGAVLRFELAKAIRAKITWVVLVLPAFFTFLSAWVDHLTRKIQVLGESKSADVYTAFVEFAKGADSGFILGGLLILLYSSMIVANEGHWRTFKTVMLRPHRRLEWILAKFALLLLLIVVMVAGVSASALSAGSIFGDYTDYVLEGTVMYPKAEMIHSSLIALSLVLPPLIALAAFGLMFSTMTDHTGIATSTCLGAYFVLEAAKGSMDEQKRSYLFNSFMPSLLDTSYFRVLQDLARGIFDTDWDKQQAFLYHFNIVIPLVSAAGFLLVATVIFYRRNFLV